MPACRRQARCTVHGFSARLAPQMKVLFIGDIVGSPGRRIVVESVRGLATQHAAELIIANCENAAAGFGITPPLVQELLEAGIDVLTGGNHTFDRKEILPYFEQGAAGGRLLRPANYPAAPGSGVYEIGRASCRERV